MGSAANRLARSCSPFAPYVRTAAQTVPTQMTPRRPLASGVSRSILFGHSQANDSDFHCQHSALALVAAWERQRPAPGCKAKWTLHDRVVKSKKRRPGKGGARCASSERVPLGDVFATHGRHHAAAGACHRGRTRRAKGGETFVKLNEGEVLTSRTRQTKSLACTTRCRPGGRAHAAHTRPVVHACDHSVLLRR